MKKTGERFYGTIWGNWLSFHSKLEWETLAFVLNCGPHCACPVNDVCRWSYQDIFQSLPDCCPSDSFCLLPLSRLNEECALCAQSCLISCDNMDCSPPGSSVREIFQARILDWVAISYSRRSSRPRDPIYLSCISCIGRQILYHCTTRETQDKWRDAHPKSHWAF